MQLLDKLSGKSKKTAVAAVSAFVAANPLISAFIAGAGVVIYFTYRAKRGY